MLAIKAKKIFECSIINPALVTGRLSAKKLLISGFSLANAG